MHVNPLATQDVQSDTDLAKRYGRLRFSSLTESGSAGSSYEVDGAVLPEVMCVGSGGARHFFLQVLWGSPAF